jgi:integrase
VIRVHRQLSRHREHARLKTEAGRREVVLAAPLARRLREHRLASRYKQSSDFVFANTLGRGLDYRDVGEGFRQAVERAGLQVPGKLTLHSHRHGFASLLIANGLNVVYVSRQLGHANPSITLEVYAHLFDRDRPRRYRKRLWKRATQRRRATAEPGTTEGGPCGAPSCGSFVLVR